MHRSFSGRWVHPCVLGCSWQCDPTAAVVTCLTESAAQAVLALVSSAWFAGECCQATMQRWH